MTTIRLAQRSRRLIAAGVGLTTAATLVACSSSSSSSSPPASASPSGTASGGQVLLVGTYQGHAGKYKTIQSAVDAAAPGDWILVAPGDYKETADLTNPPKSFEHGAF